jgi:serine/threonine-protein kinase
MTQTSGVSDLVGRVLAGRYRLLASIGAGGGGRVYVADDVRLRRRVAVKVLHAALADDAGFLRRFRAEAQLAAALHHPHVVAVYDWGEDGVPFMVLELLTGGSVRSMLDAGVELSPAQACVVGRQVASALEYSHERGLVHRDIKPANLLFDEHGIVRVADFGLARALAEASWTEPAGAVVGTARYAAPEQATGAPLDGRADMYALGLVLVEAVTGQVPFAADTPLGTLAVRTQQSVVAPDELGALAEVVERAGQIDPDDRYRNAREMADALGAAARELPPPGPLRLTGLGSTVDDAEPTELPRSARIFDQDAPTQLVEAQEDVQLGPEIRPAPKRSRNWLGPVLVGMLIVGVIAAAIGAVMVAAPGGASSVPVPRLVGLTEEQATAVAEDAGLSVTVERRASDDPAERVIGQSPNSGGWVSDGGEVTLVVSRGPRPVEIPDIAGMDGATAAATLAERGFTVNPTREFNDTVPFDLVIRTEPAAGEKQAPDSAVTVVFSDGPNPVPIQDVSGMGFDEAAAALQGQGFTVSRADEFSDDVESGKVIGTTPAAGEPLQPNNDVTIRVSKGPELVQVPDLVGMTVEQARARLVDLGLRADVEDYEPGGRVRAQDPRPGAMVRKNAQVTLFL